MSRTTLLQAYQAKRDNCPGQSMYEQIVERLADRQLDFLSILCWAEEQSYLITTGDASLIIGHFVKELTLLDDCSQCGEWVPVEQVYGDGGRLLCLECVVALMASREVYRCG